MGWDMFACSARSYLLKVLPKSALGSESIF